MSYSNALIYRRDEVQNWVGEMNCGTVGLGTIDLGTALPANSPIERTVNLHPT